MKEEICYLYNFNNIEIHKGTRVTFSYDGINYSLYNTNRREEELNEIYNLIINNDLYDKLVKTRFNKVIFMYEGKNYALIKHNHRKINIVNYIINNNTNLNIKRSMLLHSNWYMLISKKIDYIEYQYKHINGKYKLIDESINYYIGLAENSLNYLKYTMKTNINVDNITVSHRRLDSNNSFYNPLNLILDSKVRDVSSILKYAFLNKININIDKIINDLNFSKYQYGKLISRMLYPSFYFDIYEKIVNDNYSEDSLKEVIERSLEYQEYLYTIIESINKKAQIKKIDWLKPF